MPARTPPDIAALALFVSAVRHASISRAGRERGVTQQTASWRLRALERDLGLRLLTRGPRGSVPTPAGELVLAWAENVLAAADRLQAGIDTLGGRGGRELVVAASQTVAAHLLPAWLVALRDRQVEQGREAASVRLVFGNSVEITAHVRDGSADLGFIESPDIPNGLSSRFLTTDEIVLVVPPRHPWTQRPWVALSEVAQTPLATREEGSGTRDTWERAIGERLGREPAAPAAVLYGTAAVRSAVVDGLAPALLPAVAVADDVRLERLRVVRIQTEPLVRPITALWRGGAGDLLPTAAELLDVTLGDAAHSTASRIASSVSMSTSRLR